MKKIFIAIFALSMFTGFGVSVACAEMYISGSLGAVMAIDSDFDDDYSGEFHYDTGYGLVGAIGTSINKLSRLELEIGYRVNDLDEVKIDGYGSTNLDGDVSTFSLMGNGYFDMDLGSIFTPFVGAGIGYANIQADIDDIGDNNDDVLAYQFIAGGSLALSKQLYLDLQYRYFATSDPTFQGIETEYATHNAMVGLRYHFY